MDRDIRERRFEVRKKREIIETARLLAGELSTVGKGSVARMSDGSTVDVSRYAHGAAVALGLLAMYAKGYKSPTVGEIISVAIDWHEDHTRSMSEHPEDISSKVVDLRGEGADHE